MPIPVHRVRQMGDGSLEVMIRGALAEAEYVSGRLRAEPGVSVTGPVVKDNTEGFVYLGARGVTGRPLTRDRALALLGEDPQIELRLGTGNGSD